MTSSAVCKNIVVGFYLSSKNDDVPGNVATRWRTVMFVMTKPALDTFSILAGLERV